MPVLMSEQNAQTLAAVLLPTPFLTAMLSKALDVGIDHSPIDSYKSAMKIGSKFFTKDISKTLPVFMVFPSFRAQLSQSASPYLGRVLDVSSLGRSYLSSQAITVVLLGVMLLLGKATQTNSGILQVSVLAIAAGVSCLLTIKSLAFDAIFLGIQITLMLIGAVVGAVFHASGFDFLLESMKPPLEPQNSPVAAA